MSDKLIKVLIVDDSLFIQKVLKDILDSDNNIEVIGFAKNGIEAIEKVADLKPDVVTMDVEMPVMNGIEAVKRIMNENPVPIVMLSSLTYEGAEATLSALDFGAVDFVQKPTNIFKLNIEKNKNLIITKVKTAYKAKIYNSKEYYQKKIIKKTLPLPEKSKQTVIAIAISTGGPRALQYILPLIPANISASILIVQHMPPNFTKSLAQRLDNISSIHVKEAENGEAVKQGKVYIAPGGYHMKAIDNESGISIQLTKDEPVSGHRPSGDVLFNSLANSKIRRQIIGVVMTGMGSDGTTGIINLKNNKGAYIIAQDEKSCIVYGMPKSVIKTGVVDEITPLEDIIKNIIIRLGV
ncbi:chemotaxis response regulator protein-glutamate methylesterase [Serpentinicella sp. ANB-PHB4]|uniref:protein-glutamate methylesterase/protein-glutamine glutaminase n=1 Tax=Serpentinicella sp. ANB-PHB4 TaxID=3074076 RepID=UPI00285D6CF8|nr:chemotaxis response regulator protein-glutamate methylesterase [Serpentinicella sp. ANB-PHB4]MDR5658246.1 chemotaxis response regulator protein-glutamate methylesterase [Serpentinicella sp. ANB-PHB4]